jgi:hypothetical protein
MTDDIVEKGSELLNDIKTWRQGQFIEFRKYDKWPEEKKQRAREREKFLVRPSATGNAICYCGHPEDAKWIAERLNLASKLEKKYKEENEK